MKNKIISDIITPIFTFIAFVIGSVLLFFLGQFAYKIIFKILRFVAMDSIDDFVIITFSLYILAFAGCFTFMLVIKNFKKYVKKQKIKNIC